MMGINESGTYYFKNIKIDIDKIKSCIFKNNINNCVQKSNFDGLIKELINEEYDDNNSIIDTNKNHDKSDNEKKKSFIISKDKKIKIMIIYISSQLKIKIIV